MIGFSPPIVAEILDITPRGRSNKGF